MRNKQVWVWLLWRQRALEHYRDIGVATDVCLPYHQRNTEVEVPKGLKDEVKLAWKARNAETCFEACADGSAYNPSSNN